MQAMAYLSASQSPGQPQDVATEDADKDRKLVRTSSLELVVAKPAEAAEKIRALAERVGGFLARSQIRGDQDISGGSLTIRVPAARFEDARSEIRKLGLRVESERIEAQDVTRQYVDQGANLRNLRAEEGQYLGILKQAKTVKDTLEVSEKIERSARTSRTATGGSRCAFQTNRDRGHHRFSASGSRGAGVWVELATPVSDEACVARRARWGGDVFVDNDCDCLFSADDNFMAGYDCDCLRSGVEDAALGGAAVLWMEARCRSMRKDEGRTKSSISGRLDIFRLWFLAAKDPRDAANGAAHGQFAFDVGKENFAGAASAVIPALEQSEVLHCFQR